MKRFYDPRTDKFSVLSGVTGFTAFLFGPIYFLVKKAWRPFFILSGLIVLSIIFPAAFLLLQVAWVYFAYKASDIVSAVLRQHGLIELTNAEYEQRIYEITTPRIDGDILHAKTKLFLSLKVGQVVPREQIKAGSTLSKHVTPLIRECAYRMIKAFPGFTSSNEYLASDGMDFIALDANSMKLMIGSCSPDLISYRAKVISVREIIGVDVLEDAKPKYRTDLRTSLTGAAIGGLVFGGAGAIVGAVAAKGNQTAYGANLLLRMDNIDTPTIEFNFLELPCIKDTPSHHIALSHARDWANRMKVVLHRLEMPKAQSAD